MENDAADSPVRADREADDTGSGTARERVRALLAGAVRGMNRLFIITGWLGVLALIVVQLMLIATRMPASPPASAFRGLVFAHRGQSAGDEPENTLAAIRAAHAAGATALEIDVHLTSDGVPVAMHDETVDRTTDGTGSVGAMSLSEVRGLDAGMGRERWTGEQVPTIDEVVGLAHALDLPLELDVKDVDTERFAPAISQILDRHDAFERVLVSSFRPNVLRAVRAHDPRVVTGLAIRSNATGFAAVDQLLVSEWLPRWLGVGVIEPHRDLVSRERIEAWHAEGFVLNVWTVNDARQKQMLRAQGVSFTTNCPGTGCDDEASDAM